MSIANNLASLASGDFGNPGNALTSKGETSNPAFSAVPPSSPITSINSENKIEGRLNSSGNYSLSSTSVLEILSSLRYSFSIPSVSFSQIPWYQSLYRNTPRVQALVYNTVNSTAFSLSSIPLTLNEPSIVIFQIRGTALYNGSINNASYGYADSLWVIFYLSYCQETNLTTFYPISGNSNGWGEGPGLKNLGMASFSAGQLTKALVDYNAVGAPGGNQHKGSAIFILSAGTYRLKMDSLLEYYPGTSSVTSSSGFGVINIYKQKAPANLI